MPVPLPQRFIVMTSNIWRALPRGTKSVKGQFRRVCLVQLHDHFEGWPQYAGKDAVGVKRLIFRSEPIIALSDAEDLRKRIERIADALNNSWLAIQEIERHPRPGRELRAYAMELYKETS